MDLQANKTDGKVLPLSNRRIAADEWNQLAASCMAFITAAGLTPDALDNEQFLNAFKAIAADLELVGANTNLSNLTPTGEDHFCKKDASNITSINKIANAFGMDTSNGTALASGTTLSAPGWVVCTFTDSNYGVAEFQIDGVTVFQWSYQAVANTRKGTFFVSAGQVFTIVTSGTCTATAEFYPLKGI